MRDRAEARFEGNVESEDPRFQESEPVRGPRWRGGVYNCKSQLLGITLPLRCKGPLTSDHVPDYI